MIKQIKQFVQKQIKQFLVTNSSKELPGSIVNKTLKTEILIIIDTSKELDFMMILDTQV